MLNIGNTWSPSLQAAGALLPWDETQMAAIGGSARFEPAALATAGAEGQPPAAVPLYSKVYELYYNKKMFAAAGITTPPATWDDFVADAKKLTKSGSKDGTQDQWGLALRGKAATVALHYAFILGSAHGASFFSGQTPTFDTPAAVAGIEQYLSWMGKDAIVNPGDAENADWAKVYDEFAQGKAAMMLVQTLGPTLDSYHLTSADYGVAPMPQATGPGATNTASFVGGTNVAVFKNTHNLTASVDLVKFLTSAPEQTILNTAYGTVPAVKDATGPAFDTDEVKIARQEMAQRAAPLPRVPTETQFETLIGDAVVNWLADTATGKQPDPNAIAASLKSFSGQVSAGG